MGLLFGDDSNDEISIACLSTAGNHPPGNLDLERMKRSVTDGLNRANKSFGTHFKVKEIEYVESDTPDYTLYEQCAFLIAKGIHEGIAFKVIAKN